MKIEAVEETATKPAEDAAVSKFAGLGDEIAQALDAAQKSNKVPYIAPGKWPVPPIPAKCKPGYAVITDCDGNVPRVVEARLVMAINTTSMLRPIEGRERGEITCGQAITSVNSGEIIVQQFTPYPDFRDDGEICVYDKATGGVGRAAYPNAGKGVVKYEEFNGTFYHRNSMVAQKMLEAARGEAK